MDALRSLKAALANARWLSRTDEALALVPDLVSEMPGLIPIQVHGSELPMAPCAFSGRLRAPLAQTLLTRLEEAHAGRAVESMRALSPAALEDDALVRVLCELLCESAVYGVKAQTLVVLEFSRQCSGLLLGDEVLLRRVPEQERLRQAIERMEAMQGAARGDLLGAVAFSLQARLGAAYARTGGMARPGRVYQALAASRLPLVMRPDDLEFPRDLVLVARILEMPASQGTLDAAWLAAKGALEEGMAQDSGAGATLRSLAGEGASLQAQLLNPPVVGLSLSLLPALMNEAGLRKQGLSVAEARSLLGAGLVAATSSLLEVVNALRRLDLLASLSASILPVERQGGQWVSDGTPVQAPLLELLSPGSMDEASHGYVVGATLGELAAGLSSHAMALPALGALGKYWVEMSARAAELNGRTVQGGPPFLAVFSDAPSARLFEDELRAGLDNLRLDMGPFGELSLSGTARVSGAEGPLAGGWSGDVLVIQGPPVEAVFFAPTAPASVWDEDSMTHEDGPTGPIEDPFAPTPVSVEEDASPPSDWAGLSDLVGDTGELPALDLGNSTEDLGEAVSYDLLGAFELASRADDPEVDRLLEPYSQDIMPSGESVLSESLDRSLNEDLKLSDQADRSEYSDPSMPVISLDSDGEFDMGGGVDSLLAEYTESTMDSLDSDLSLEPSEPALSVDRPQSVERARSVENSVSMEPESTEPPPSIEMPDPASEVSEVDSIDDDGVAFDVEIEDDEDEDSEVDSVEFGSFEESGEFSGRVEHVESVHDLLGSTDDLSVEDDRAPEESSDQALSTEGDGYFLPPPEPSTPSQDDDVQIDWENELSQSGEVGQSAGAALLGSSFGAELTGESSLDREWDDDLPTNASSVAPVFPDLGLDLDLDEPELPPDPEPSTPSQPAISRRDLDFLFQGYVVVRKEGEMVFGRSYGSTLVDVHRYDTEHTRQAYLAFAKDKIRERFSPSSDDTWTLSARDRADPLSLDQMMMAFDEAQGH